MTGRKRVAGRTAKMLATLPARLIGYAIAYRLQWDWARHVWHARHPKRSTR